MYLPSIGLISRGITNAFPPAAGERYDLNSPFRNSDQNLSVLCIPYEGYPINNHAVFSSQITELSKRLPDTVRITVFPVLEVFKFISPDRLNVLIKALGWEHESNNSVGNERCSSE